MGCAHGGRRGQRRASPRFVFRTLSLCLLCSRGRFHTRLAVAPSGRAWRPRCDWCGRALVLPMEVCSVAPPAGFSGDLQKVRCASEGHGPHTPLVRGLGAGSFVVCKPPLLGPPPRPHQSHEDLPRPACQTPVLPTPAAQGLCGKPAFPFHPRAAVCLLAPTCSPAHRNPWASCSFSAQIVPDLTHGSLFEELLLFLQGSLSL